MRVVYYYDVSDGIYEDYDEITLQHTIKYTPKEYKDIVSKINDSLYDIKDTQMCDNRTIVDVMVREYGFQEVISIANYHLWDYPTKVK